VLGDLQWPCSISQTPSSVQVTGGKQALWASLNNRLNFKSKFLVILDKGMFMGLGDNELRLAQGNMQSCVLKIFTHTVYKPRSLARQTLICIIQKKVCLSEPGSFPKTTQLERVNCTQMYPDSISSLLPSVTESSWCFFLTSDLWPDTEHLRNPHRIVHLAHSSSGSFKDWLTVYSQRHKRQAFIS
jgi:hypothetical protein